MQTVWKDGLVDMPREFNKEQLEKQLGNPKVSHVEVFGATTKEIEQRTEKAEKSFLARHKQSKKGFKKAPSINK